MADHRSSIDLTTLAEVQRLLASTEFASIDEVARRTGVIDIDREQSVLADSADASPLPRRR